MASARKNSHQKVDEAEAYARMEALAQSSPRADEEAAVDLLLDARAIVETYIDATQSRSANWSGAKELGEACFWLQFLSGSKHDDAHFRLVVELLTPGRGQDLFALLPRVRALRYAVLNVTEPQPKGPSANSSVAHQSSEDDVF